VVSRANGRAIPGSAISGDIFRLLNSGLVQKSFTPDVKRRARKKCDFPGLKPHGALYDNGKFRAFAFISHFLLL
jgi:hypothetical protein